jgi:hypothetical protein
METEENIMKELDAAKLVADVTSLRYPCSVVTVKDGEAFNETTSEMIPLKDVMYQSLPLDGVYLATEATCGGSCSVGIPAPKCVKKGIYSSTKCAVYSLSKTKDTDSLHITVGDLKKLVENI